tara:strand:- start:2358 stop:3161 length:804 start_codon:yes stop_codon:yes gene_type:complete
MITCDVYGHDPTSNNGLGNQMFCIAASIGLANRLQTQAFFPDLNLKHYEYYGDTIFHKLSREHKIQQIVNSYKEPHYTSTRYNEIPLQDNMKISGFFQSYKYFNFCRDEILNLFQVCDPMEQKIINNYGMYLDSNVASIHVRRADYLKFSGHYENLGISYYKKAIDLFPETQIIFVFSDDIKWCKKHLPSFGKLNIYVEGQTDVEDLWLMTKMKNNIIANSTFSWWGAYLNKNQNRVVAPTKWFGPKRTADNSLETKDLYPDNWETI